MAHGGKNLVKFSFVFVQIKVSIGYNASGDYVAVLIES